MYVGERKGMFLPTKELKDTLSHMFCDLKKSLKLQFL